MAPHPAPAPRARAPGGGGGAAGRPRRAAVRATPPTSRWGPSSTARPACSRRRWRGSATSRSTSSPPAGPGVDPAAFGPQPDHVLIAPYLPHALLLPRCRPRGLPGRGGDHARRAHARDPPADAAPGRRPVHRRRGLHPGGRRARDAPPDAFDAARRAAPPPPACSPTPRSARRRRRAGRRGPGDAGGAARWWRALVDLPRRAAPPRLARQRSASTSALCRWPRSS